MKKIVLLFCVLLAVFQAYSQKTVIIIEHADVADYDSKLGKDVQRLLGDVVLRQDSTVFFCDSAYLNENTKNFDAFGNVHIAVNDSLDIFSDLLKYTGETRIAELFNHVRMVDDSTVLTTEYLIYNRLTKLATYPDYGVITSGDKRLESKKGYYQSDIRDVYFRKDVVVTSPKDTLYSDTLIYNLDSEIVTIVGPTIIKSEKNILYGNFGWYNTVTEQAFLNRRAVLNNQGQTVSSDSMFYDKLVGFGELMGSVDISDTINKMIINGKYGQVWEKDKRSFVTDSTLAIIYDDTDSLFLHSDTLFLTLDEEQKAKELQAYYKVRFYRKDLQGKCDSLIYKIADSTIKLRSNPILWAEENQMLSDSINIFIRNEEIDSLVLYNSAFIVSKDSIEGFNQIKGKNMVVYFNNNEMYLVAVDGNAQTIYWLREDDGSLVGVNSAQSSYLEIDVEDNKIRRIKYYNKPTEVTVPEEEVPTMEKELKGFRWHADIRPTDKIDIYRKIDTVEEDTSNKHSRRRKQY